MPDHERSRDEMEIADDEAAGKQRRVGLAVRSATARVFFCCYCNRMLGYEVAVGRAPKCSACGRWMTPSRKPRTAQVRDGGEWLGVADDYVHPESLEPRVRRFGLKAV